MVSLSLGKYLPVAPGFMAVAQFLPIVFRWPKAPPAPSAGSPSNSGLGHYPNPRFPLYLVPGVSSFIGFELSWAFIFWGVIIYQAF